MKKHFRAPHPGRILLYALLILAAVLCFFLSNSKGQAQPAA